MKAYQPYHRLVRSVLDLRKDVVRLINQAVTDQVRTHALVDNRLEGSAPLTIQALVDQLKRDARTVR